MIFDLTYFAEKALRGLLKTQKKQIAFRSTSNVGKDAFMYLFLDVKKDYISFMNHLVFLFSLKINMVQF